MCVSIAVATYQYVGFKILTESEFCQSGDCHGLFPLARSRSACGVRGQGAAGVVVTGEGGVVIKDRAK